MGAKQEQREGYAQSLGSYTCHSHWQIRDILVNTTNAVGNPLQSAAVSSDPSLEVPVDTTYILFPIPRVTLCPPKPPDLLHFAPKDPHDHSSKALSS